MGKTALNSLTFSLRPDDTEELKPTASTLIYKKGRLYDCLYPGFTGDTEYYSQVARKGKVLYLGVGTGRIFGNLLAANHQIYGIEISSSMIKELLRRNPHIPKKNIIKGDVRKTNVILDKFDIVIAPYSFLNFFNRKDIIKINHNIQSWLKPGGKFITDIFSPYTQVFPYLNKKEIIEIKNRETSARIEVTYDHISQEVFEYSTVKTNNAVEKVSLKNFYYYPGELIHLFEDSKFKNIKLYDGYSKDKLNMKSDVIRFEMVK